MKNNRSADVDKFMEELPADIKELAEKLRYIIHEADDNLKEEIKWRKPCFSKGGTDICYLQTAKKHVNLGFYFGASLQDEGNLLEGEGKKMRHIRVRKPEEIQPDKFTALIQEAIAYKS
ncbi:DUF1801 domain-containing protein [Virgibacillus sp. YIM 98842]|uniref:DUF1801 domain-containing protein n=1 Tax=Virgibacillus sp. YIM 98842 TaxID=2663533 RepID=UPI0013DCDBE8|nr:DUF1801 domain-containing protein [Virgibacillus sp. YIM 98842]